MYGSDSSVNVSISATSSSSRVVELSMLPGRWPRSTSSAVSIGVPVSCGVAMGEPGSGSRSIGRGSLGGLPKSLAGMPISGEFMGGVRAASLLIVSWWCEGCGTSTGCGDGDGVGFSTGWTGRVWARAGCCLLS